jgi:pimeloyl-ACP methyl ester carboxylesterase
MHKVSFRKADVEGFNIFYREAGPRDAQTVLLLHGFPTVRHQRL